jgi:hypothetical protein
VLHLGRLQPCLQTSDEAGKATTDKHSNVLRTVVNYGCKIFTILGAGLKIASRVTRRLGKIAQILEKVAKTVAKPKMAKISSSKVNLRVQNIYINPLLKP